MQKRWRPAARGEGSPSQALQRLRDWSASLWTALWRTSAQIQFLRSPHPCRQASPPQNPL